jgi:hypothetical protein
MAVCFIFIFLLFPTNIPLAADWSTAGDSDGAMINQPATGLVARKSGPEIVAAEAAAAGASVGLNKVAWHSIRAGALAAAHAIVAAISDDDAMAPTSVNSSSTHN